VSSFLGLCLAVASLAQSNITGEVIAGTGVDLSRLYVEVVPLTQLHQSPERVMVGPNGRFEARNLTAGSYQFRVLDERGNLLGTATQNAGPHYGSIEIRLPSSGRSRNNPVNTGPISVSRLRQDPNGNADRELYLALWEVKQKNWKGAEKHFEKALRADEGHGRAAANFAALELQLGNSKRAEEIARKALVHDPANPRLRHALGASLAAQNIYTEETIEGFVAAAAETPKTFLAAAQIEFNRGNWVKARQYASSYLKTEDKEYRELAERITTLPDKKP